MYIELYYFTAFAKKTSRIGAGESYAYRSSSQALTVTDRQDGTLRCSTNTFIADGGAETMPNARPVSLPPRALRTRRIALDALFCAIFTGVLPLYLQCAIIL